MDYIKDLILSDAPFQKFLSVSLYILLALWAVSEVRSFRSARIRSRKRKGLRHA